MFMAVFLTRQLYTAGLLSQVYNCHILQHLLLPSHLHNLLQCTICPLSAANAANRGIEMTAILTRLASAVIAVSLSGAVLSVALV
jgi:hypothetical protein